MFIFLSVFVYESRICDLILSVYVTVFTIYSVLLDTMGKYLGDMGMEAGYNGTESEKER